MTSDQGQALLDDLKRINAGAKPLSFEAWRAKYFPPPIVAVAGDPGAVRRPAQPAPKVPPQSQQRVQPPRVQPSVVNVIINAGPSQRIAAPVSKPVSPRPVAPGDPDFHKITADYDANAGLVSRFGVTREQYMNSVFRTEVEKRGGTFPVRR